MMQLIGMMDSPYVRRVAISLKFLAVPFEHRSVSVFGGYDEFAKLNPVVKAPTLITDEGIVLMESSLILQYLETLYPSGFGRASQDAPARLAELRQIGLALIACEKTVQLVYETNLRPPEKQHGPWIDRVRAQVLAAYQELERETVRQSPPGDARITQGFITTAVAWRFTTHVLPDLLKKDLYPYLAKHSATAEALWEFRSVPLD